MLITKNERRKIWSVVITMPKEIRSWLASEKTTYLIADLNRKLGLKDSQVRVIPTTILRLVTKEIEPTNFIHSLSEELQITLESAKKMAEEVKSKILDPFGGELLNWGVDVTLVDVIGTPPKKREEDSVEVRVERKDEE